MSREQLLRDSLGTVQVDDAFSEAVLGLRDQSKLCFRHTVDERWAKAFGADGQAENPGLAGELLSAIATFRLNAKHLDIQFEDGSRWDERLQDLNPDSGEDGVE